MSVVARQRDTFRDPPGTQRAALAPRPPRADLPVFCPDGYVGRVVELVPIWLDQPTHLLVRWGAIVPQTVSIPIAWVDEIEGDRVRLSVRRRHVARLLPLRTDDVIAADVWAAVAGSPEFRDPAASNAIEIACHAGSIVLRGNVRTVWRALQVEALARRVRGVVDVSNLLVGDDELEDQIVWAIKREQQLAIDGLHVDAAYGVVRITGRVHAAEACALLLRIARQVRGVREISNGIEVVARPRRVAALSADPHALFAAQRRSQTPAQPYVHNYRGASHASADSCV